MIKLSNIISGLYFSTIDITQRVLRQQYVLDRFYCLLSFYRSFIVLCPSFSACLCLLWSPYVIGRPYIFSSCSYFLLFFPRLISAVGDWMSTILLQMAWP